MTVDETARRSGEYFDQGYYCAESVLLAVGDGYGIQSPWIPNIATGFCSGIARTGGICGAVSGAIMAIGLIEGRQTPTAPLTPCYRSVTWLIEQFTERFGSVTCPTLIGCRLDTPEGQRQFEENNRIADCRRYTVAATAMAMQALRLAAHHDNGGKP